jgi:hypothetical protein
MAIAYLNQDQILEMVKAMSEAGMVTTSVLDALLAGIPARYAAGLPESGRPMDRLMVSLDRLNTTGQLSDGKAPLLTWLKNAAVRGFGYPDAESAINRALASVSAQISGIAPGPQIKAKLPEKNEKIVHQSDLLPFRFLQRGAENGAAVARLSVPRFDSGVQARTADGGVRRNIGTGWLLTRELIITNHHVVNARDSAERDASLADLESQARATEVAFDYDAPEAAMTMASVRAVEAFSPCDGPLDYAILRLGSPVGRTPLTLATTAMVLPAGGTTYPSVNIIQHPEGRPKEVACRNNTVYRAEGVDLSYFTDTMAGSSGSPVFDDGWRVVALHKKWDYVQTAYQGKDTAWANVGTQIFAILADLTRAGKTDLLAEILRG